MQRYGRSSSLLTNLLILSSQILDNQSSDLQNVGSFGNGDSSVSFNVLQITRRFTHPPRKLGALSSRRRIARLIFDL